MKAPERIIPQRVDTAEILRSPDLIGCYGFKPIPQTRDYTCGAAAVASVFGYYGKRSTEYDCLQSLDTNKVTGTSWYSMYKLIKEKGFKSRLWARFPTAELIARAKEGHPTIVEWLDWGGHWVVHVGYEPRRGVLVFADPAKPRSNFTCHLVEDFERFWVAGGAREGSKIPALAIPVDPPAAHSKGPTLITTTPRVRHKLVYDWVTRRPWNGKVLQHA